MSIELGPQVCSPKHKKRLNARTRTHVNTNMWKENFAGALANVDTKMSLWKETKIIPAISIQFTTSNFPNSDFHRDRDRQSPTEISKNYPKFWALGLPDVPHAA